MSEQGKLSELDSILLDYSLPYSQGKSFVDSGNLYYAATEYRSAYQALQQQCEKLVEALEKLNQPLNYINPQFNGTSVAGQAIKQYEKFKNQEKGQE